MRIIGFVALLLLTPLAAAQAETAPAFTAGDVTVYAHNTEDGLTVWMNTLQDDGAAAPYYLNGEPTEDPTGTLSVNPVADEAFEARMVLTPGLQQGVVLDGTITVQAYIGGGAYTAGSASIATSLVVDGEVVASADAKDHVMTPKAGVPGTYDPIDWSMEVSGVEVAAGATLEWVVSGTVEAGNNVYMATYEARGRSHIVLPVREIIAPAADDTGGDDGNETVNETVGPEPGNETQVEDGGNETVSDDDGAAPDEDAPSVECDGNATCDEGLDVAADDQESPGLALPMTLIMVAAIAVLRRRS